MTRQTCTGSRRSPLAAVSRTIGAARRWIGNVIADGIRQHGIRNAAQTTIAPTGTIATVAGCEGYGCEPVFALAYIRHVNDNGKDLQLTYASPLFEQALVEAGLDRDSPPGRSSSRSWSRAPARASTELPERIRRRVRRLAGYHRRRARAHAGRPAGLCR